MKCRIVALILVVFFSGIVPSSAQQKKSKPRCSQYTFTLDNDYFLLNGSDRYYTNGVFLSFDQAISAKKLSVIKKTYTIDAGQMIFKQFTRKVWPTVLVSNAYPGGVGAIDRPITGYLFGKYSQSSFYKKQRMVKWGVSVGSIGSLSFGKEMQSGFHKSTGVGNWWDWVWDYQLKSEVGINTHGQFAFSVFKGNSFVQVTPITNATLGTIFTEASQSVLIQIGKANEMHESAYWNSRVSNNCGLLRHNTEMFFYYLPGIKHQFYNATVQGGLFAKDKGPITSEVKPWVASHKVGAMLSNGKYTFDMGVVFMGKEAASQFNNHAYGSIKVAYRF
jgi:lipid A 3-O-deacylase